MVAAGAAGGNIPTTLGLTAGSGSQYTGTVGGQTVETSHQTASDMGKVLHAWAKDRIVADLF